MPHQKGKTLKQYIDGQVSDDALFIQCMSAVGRLLGKMILDLCEDPIKMAEDRVMNSFVQPFLEYCWERTDLQEAYNTWNQMTVDFVRDEAEGLKGDIVRIFFELKTGKDFDEVLEALRKGEQWAAIDMVTVFKETFKQNADVKRIIDQALSKGDADFFVNVTNAFQAVPEDKRINYDWFVWARLNQDAILKQSFEETVRQAKQAGLKMPEWVKHDPDHPFKRYLSRIRVAKDRGRPQKKKLGKVELSFEDRARLMGHTTDFDFYLFGKDGREGFEKIVDDMRKTFS